MPRVRIVASGPGRKGCRCAPDEAKKPTSMCVQIQESGEGVLKRKWVVGFKVPLLNNKKIKVSRKVPRLSALKLKPPAAVSEGAKVKVEAVAAKPIIEPVRVIEPPPEIGVKVVPTPRKREAKPQGAKMVPSELAAPKPLKVIRRRKEEAPKVFETPRRSCPRLCLRELILNRIQTQRIS